MLTARSPHGWLNAHQKQVVLLYLEDELGSADGYAQTVSALDSGLKRPEARR